MKTVLTITGALALMVASATAMAEVELTVLGGQSTFNNSSFHSTDNGGTSLGNEVERQLGEIDSKLALDGSDMSADFAPGIRLGVRLGDSPVIVTIGARQSDHLDTSYDVGVRLNEQDSNLGLEVRAVRFDDDAVRAAFGSRDVEAEAVVTYDVAKYLRLGAGVTTATLDDQTVNGLLTADVVFKFGGPKPSTAPVAVIAPVVAPTVEVVVPTVEVTGERG